MNSSKQQLRNLPAIDAIINHPAVAQLKEHFAPPIMTRLARETIGELRQMMMSRKIDAQTADELLLTAIDRLQDNSRALLNSGIKRVINATGIILHTGLGRAVLAPETRLQLSDIAEGYCNLEIDLKSGKRGDRQTHASRLLRLLTGAESACVVNNNAAAVMLVLNALADGKEVIVSRGELVEIGGSFRLPEIIRKSGARLVEVGTTNKTRAGDYAKAITPRTAVLLKVHQSNFRIKGFTEEASLQEIVKIGKAKGIPVVHDLGGGILIDLKKFGLPEEPVVEDSIKTGVALATFSGDKIIGGPQAGIVVGKKKYLEEIFRNPLLRVVRCDKLTLALIESALKLFVRPQTAIERHPILRMLSEPLQIVETRARKIAAMLEDIPTLETTVAASIAEAGSGALPVEPLPSFAVGIKSKRFSDTSLAMALRQSEPAVIGYTRDNQVWMDARTINDDEIALLIDVLKRL